MDTHPILDQQRQFVRDFLTANQQRAQRETTAHSEYAAGEKAANDQYAAAEKATQQQHATAEQKAATQRDDAKSRLNSATASIDAVRNNAVSLLAGIQLAGLLPFQLNAVSAVIPADVSSGEPLSRYQDAAQQIDGLGQAITQTVNQWQRERARRRKMLIAAAVAAVILAGVGAFLYTQWSYNQQLSGYYRAGKAALEAENWQTARDQFSTLLALEPGYEDAQTLLNESLYSAGKAALEAEDWLTASAEFSALFAREPGYKDAQALLNESLYFAGKAALAAEDWQTARDQFSTLLALEPEYEDAQTLLNETYYRPGKAALEAEDWQSARDQLNALILLDPNYQDVQALINQHAEQLGPRVNPKDGALYVYVPAGDFVMGSPEGQGDDNERPQHTVSLDAFWIMQSEVTNAQYGKCVADGACTPPNNDRWQQSEYADHPVVNITWQQANDYAAWAGGRLPTEAEWEKACRGSDQRPYPWGSAAPDAERLNFDNNVGDTTPVGSYPAGVSPYGAQDMADNVWEWTADWYDAGYYSRSLGDNPSGPEDGDYRVLRGGSYENDASEVGCGVRRYHDPLVELRNWGARIVAFP